MPILLHLHGQLHITHGRHRAVRLQRRLPGGRPDVHLVWSWHIQTHYWFHMHPLPSRNILRVRWPSLCHPMSGMQPRVVRALGRHHGVRTVPCGHIRPQRQHDNVFTMHSLRPQRHLFVRVSQWITCRRDNLSLQSRLPGHRHPVLLVLRGDVQDRIRPNMHVMQSRHIQYRPRSTNGRNMPKLSNRLFFQRVCTNHL